jgi:beta-lactam-binding protein with PASTA domain
MTPGGDPKSGNARKQNPPAGALATPGDAITVTFPVRVPNVVGRTPAGASTALTAAGLTMTPGGDPKSGTARKQHPAAGALATPGDAITVIFPVAVPNVVGDTPAAASRALTVASLIMTPGGDPKSGTARKQHPAAGALATPGDAITVTFPVHVPNVVGDTPAAASKVLTVASLIMTPGGDPKSGTAISQNPVAGGLATPGDAVTVTFPSPLLAIANITRTGKTVTISIKNEGSISYVLGSGVTFKMEHQPPKGPTTMLPDQPVPNVAPGAAVTITVPDPGVGQLMGSLTGTASSIDPNKNKKTVP